MEQRENLIELLDQNCGYVEEQTAENLADHLIANGVVVLPCRCEECKSFSEGLCDNEHIGAMVFRMKREATDYCSYAERKGGDYCDEE